MKFEYYNKWAPHQLRPIGPISKQEARDRHEARSTYCVVASENDETSLVVLEWNADSVYVQFLDENGREFLCYDFVEEGTSLFLQEAQHIEYDGDSRNRAYVHTFYFSPSGSLVIRKADLLKDERFQSEPDEDHDVSPNWEPWPEFGEYQGLLKRNRA